MLDSCAALEREGWQVTRLDVDQEGLVSPDAIADGQIAANLAEVVPEAEWQTVTQAFFGASQ